jgi:hypothetical protein
MINIGGFSWVNNEKITFVYTLFHGIPGKGMPIIQIFSTGLRGVVNLL